MEVEYIFVYGTLRKSAAQDMYRVLARSCEYVADGFMQGRLYEIVGYPGAIESDDAHDQVRGEIYKTRESAQVLARLDEYEECNASFPEPHEYIRKVIVVKICGGDNVKAWAYIFNRDVSRLQQIQSGDYLEFHKKK